MAPSPNLIRVVDLENALEVEPNDTPAQATPATAPAPSTGSSRSRATWTTSSSPAKKGQVFDIRVYARDTLRSPLDSVLTVSAGQRRGRRQQRRQRRSGQLPAVHGAGRRRVRRGRHRPSQGRRTELRLPRGNRPGRSLSLTMVLPEREQYVPVTLAVPRGNRMALMVNANRANWGGDTDRQRRGTAGRASRCRPMPHGRGPDLGAGAVSAPRRTRRSTARWPTWWAGPSIRT